MIVTSKLGNERSFVMDKNEILEKSRNENKNKDEMQKAVFSKAGQRACAVGGIVCAIIIALEMIFTDSVSLSIWAVYLSITGTMLISKYTQLKKKHELIFGVFELILAAAFLVMHIIRIAG